MGERISRGISNVLERDKGCLPNFLTDEEGGGGGAGANYFLHLLIKESIILWIL